VVAFPAHPFETQETPGQVLAMKNGWQSLNSKKITTKARRTRNLFIRVLRAFVVNKVL